MQEYTVTKNNKKLFALMNKHFSLIKYHFILYWLPTNKKSLPSE